MSEPRPIQTEFKTRVLAAMSALEGYPGAPQTLGQLADDAGVSPSNLASALSLRRAMTWNALRRLHRALKLDALGLDVTIWDLGVDDLDGFAKSIHECRRGDPVELALAHMSPRTFVDLAPSGAFMGVRPVRAASKPHNPGLAVYPGQSLRITLTPPFDGFIKVICREGSEFFSLDDHLNLSHRRFRAGAEVALDREIDVEAGYYGETVFIALASAKPFEANWPRGFEPSEVISRETCADLLRGLYQQTDDTWQTAVFSVWTLPEQLSALT